MRNATAMVKVLLLSMVLASGALAQTEMVVSASGGATVPLYQTNAISSPIVANLNHGDVVKALESRFGWTLIRTAQDQLGYIQSFSLRAKEVTVAILAPAAQPAPLTNKGTPAQSPPVAAVSRSATSLNSVSRIFLTGSGTTAVELFNNIQKGKDDSRGCIQLVGREQADAILETSESTGPATWTGEGTSIVQSAVLKSPDGNILWTGSKRDLAGGGLFQRPLLKQLTAALGCKARSKR